MAVSVQVQSLHVSMKGKKLFGTENFGFQFKKISPKVTLLVAFVLSLSLALSLTLSLSDSVSISYTNIQTCSLCDSHQTHTLRLVDVWFLCKAEMRMSVGDGRERERKEMIGQE